MRKKIFNLLICSSSFLMLVSCINNQTSDKFDKISIISTTDVHCGIDQNIGYSSFAAYKEELEKTSYVSVVDCGDFLQGDYVGAISSGEYIIEIMNKVGYDLATLGNHEFDYGIATLNDRINEFNGEIVSCNVSYIGNNSNTLSKIKPYTIKQYGKTKIGFVGVTTPHTYVDSSPKNFIEDGKTVISFGPDTKEEFYSLVQNNIDNCKKDGAKYVFLVSHLGSLEQYSPYSSIDIIQNTSGCVAVLDGHAHIDLPWTAYQNKNNKETYLVDTGYKLNEFSVITISSNGDFNYEVVTSFSKSSPALDEYIKEVNKKVDELGNKVVANIDLDLKITDENGIRMVRNRETPIGNLVADAYRIITNSDISFVNGGAIRDNLEIGEVTYKDIKKVHPFGNILQTKKTTGAKILDYLEFTSMNTEIERVKDNKPCGESGAFASVSGMKYDIDTSIPTSIVVDAQGSFVKVDGPRRVKNVKVFENDKYVDIDPNKEYTVSSHNFLLSEGGDGANMFVDDPIVPVEQKFDYEVLISYIVDVLKGQLKDKYSSVEGRINIL